jgi:hypothetical protein
MNRIAELVGLAGTCLGEVVWPRPAFRKGLPSTYESAFEIRQFASLLQGASGYDAVWTARALTKKTTFNRDTPSLLLHTTCYITGFMAHFKLPWLFVYGCGMMPGQ